MTLVTSHWIKYCQQEKIVSLAVWSIASLCGFFTGDHGPSFAQHVDNKNERIVWLLALLWENDKVTAFS